MEEILDEAVSAEDLKKFERVYNNQVEEGTVTKEAKFNYAWCLVRSRYAADIRKGICLLEMLFLEEDGQNKRDYVYYLAIGYAKLKEYGKALQYVRVFLNLEPGNQQVQQLEIIIRKRMDRDGKAGMAIVGGLVALGGLAIAGIALAAKKK